MDLVGLSKVKNNLATRMSGGQQQRTAIARALIMKPSVILADEPTGNLDTASGRDVMALLKELHQQGKTIVLITHDADVASKADRSVWIQDGMIVREESAVVR